MRKSHEAREKLLRLGIFRQVDVLIDTCQGDDALPNGLDVTFEVTELRRLTGSYNTMVGNNEGSMVRLGPRLPRRATSSCELLKRDCVPERDGSLKTPAHTFIFLCRISRGFSFAVLGSIILFWIVRKQY